MEAGKIDNQICVRREAGVTASDLAQKILPLLAEKLTSLPSLMQRSMETGLIFQRKRITVEFLYDPEAGNPWGDFATWNIVETEVHGKTITTTKHHFPANE